MTLEITMDIPVMDMADFGYGYYPYYGGFGYYPHYWGGRWPTVNLFQPRLSCAEISLLPFSLPSIVDVKSADFKKNL